MKNLKENYSELKKMLKYHFSKDEGKALCLNFTVVIYKIKRSFVFDRQMSRFFSLHGSHHSALNNKNLCLFKLDLYSLVYLLLLPNK